MNTARRIALTIITLGAVAGPLYVAIAQPNTPPPAPSPQGQPQTPTAPTPPPPPEGGPRGPERRGDARSDQGMPQTIGQSMKLMNRSVGRLKRQIGDPTKKEDNLKLVNDLERGCLAAKAIDPKTVVEHAKPVEEKAAPVGIAKPGDAAKPVDIAAEYRRHLIRVLEKSLALETAIMDDKTDAAKALMSEIGKLRDEGHALMGAKDD